MNDNEVTSDALTTKADARLRDYDRVKLDLSSLIRGALRLIDERADPERHRKCLDWVTKLAEDRFILAVVGQFNRGKSSLMNAILGLDRLPVGVVPLTSVITKVSYGNPERVLIEFAGGSLKAEIPVARLPEYVTEVHNPGNEKRIVAAEVQLPSDFLRRGLYFVDTPGVGSAIVANTVTTERFLPEADAVIFVTSFDSPMAREELEFLQRVGEQIRKVFFVVNKLDLAPGEQRDQVLDFIRNRLERDVGVREPRLFALSARAGLQAKLTDSAQGLMESGLPPLEDKLVQFLTTERTREFLLRACDRTLSLVEELDPEATPGKRPDILGEIISRLTRMRDQLIGSPDSEERRSHSARPAKSSRPEAELMEAARRPCQACTRIAKAMMRFMAKFQSQIIVNENERSILASRGGLCPLHTWQYADMASPQGISSSYPDVLRATSKRLGVLAESDPSGGLDIRAASLITSPEKCRACQEQLAAQETVIGEILEKVNAKEAQESVKLPVLCLPHLSVLLRKGLKSESARTLIDFEAALFERLAENMERYALKHDGLRRGLQSDDERVAYHRGLSQLVGDKRLQAPWRVERLV